MTKACCGNDSGRASLARPLERKPVCRNKASESDNVRKICNFKPRPSSYEHGKYSFVTFRGDIFRRLFEKQEYLTMVFSLERL